MTAMCLQESSEALNPMTPSAPLQKSGGPIADLQCRKSMHGIYAPSPREISTGCYQNRSKANLPQSHPVPRNLRLHLHRRRAAQCLARVQ